jgi:hypothetical protein
VAVWETPLKVAVRMALWSVAIVPAVAVKVVEAAPAGTVIEAAGTGSEGLLLLRLTAVPPAGATFERATVQVVTAEEFRVVGVQLIELRDTGMTTLMPAVCETLLRVAVTVAA